jgi:hypothetical protein
MNAAKKKIIICYHFPELNNWSNLLAEFIGLTISSGLYEECEEINCFTYPGTEKSRGATHSIARSLEKIRFHVSDQRADLEALRYIKRMASLEDCYFNWSGARGVSYTLKAHGKRALCVADWARMLNHFAIMRYRDCVKALETVDACGVNWFPGSVEMQIPFPHFSGGGWWSKSEYISRLPKLLTDDELKRMADAHPVTSGDRSIAGLSGKWTLNGEFWIGLGNPSIKEMHRSYPVNAYPNWHYHNLYPREMYDSDGE